MALLVDPPQRDGAGDGSSGQEPTRREPEGLATDLSETDAGETSGTEPRLAEPPITGGRVEALMGELVRVLSHSRLARPLPAVVLTALTFQQTLTVPGHDRPAPVGAILA